MKIIFIILLTTVLTSTARILNAQKLEDYTIEYDTKKIKENVYHKLEVFDKRKVKKGLGIIQRGLLNTETLLMPKTALSDQLKQLFATIAETVTDTSNTLAIVLREIIVREVTGTVSEKGYVHFKANMFSKKNNNYYPLHKIDTLIVIESFDVTHKIVSTLNDMFYSSVANHLGQFSTNTSIHYTKEQIKNLDSIDKRQIPLYASDILVDGIYKNYNSFKLQQPDATIEDIEIKGDVVGKISGIKDNNKLVINKNINYALVYKNKAYIFNRGEAVPLKKINDEYRFKGYINSDPDMGRVFLATMLFGVVGGLLASTKSYEYGEAEIDFNTGTPIKIVEPNK